MFEKKSVQLMIFCSLCKEFLNEQLSQEEEEKENDGMDEPAKKKPTGN